MKKRIIALVLACMLICSIAITASAATYSGRYGDLLYAATTTCYTNRFGSVMEGTPVNGANVADYTMRSEVIVYQKVGSGEQLYNIYIADSTTGLLTNNKTLSITIKRINATYRINNYQVYNAQVNAS